MSKTILTADDSASMREIIAVVLKTAGYNVVPANDGVEALEKIQANKVDLLITDLNMPRMDGVGLIRGVRALPQYKYLPIIMLTTESSPERKQEGKEAGASGWLVKPFRDEQLLSVLKKLIPN